MKKFIAILTALTIVFSLAGCVSQQQSEGKAPVSVSESESQSGKKANSDVSVAEKVVFDGDGIKITVKGLETDGLFGAELKLLVENNGSQNITVQARNLSVNGIMADYTLSCDVAAGKKANDEISIGYSGLKAAGVEVIKDIEFSFHIFDSDSWDNIVDSDVIRIETDADPSYVQTVDDSGFVAVDRDGVKLVIKKLDSEDSFWGADVYVYVENNSDKDITVQTRDVSVNGFMADPSFSCDVPAGKKAFDTITFMESDLENNGITDITTLELYFHVFDMNNWNGIFDSDTVTVTF
ncbi:MAG: lipoprotein [Acutalibacteraceae bacterium]